MNSFTTSDNYVIVHDNSLPGYDSHVMQYLRWVLGYEIVWHDRYMHRRNAITGRFSVEDGDPAMKWLVLLALGVLGVQLVVWFVSNDTPTSSGRGSGVG